MLDSDSDLIELSTSFSEVDIGIFRWSGLPCLQIPAQDQNSSQEECYLLFDYKSFEDVYSDKDEFNKSLDNEYDTNNNTTKG